MGGWMSTFTSAAMMRLGRIFKKLASSVTSMPSGIRMIMELLDSSTRFTSSVLDDGAFQFIAAWCQDLSEFTSFKDRRTLLLCVECRVPLNAVTHCISA